MYDPFKIKVREVKPIKASENLYSKKESGPDIDFIMSTSLGALMEQNRNHVDPDALGEAIDRLERELNKEGI